MEQLRVALGGQHGCAPQVAAEGRAERLFSGNPLRDQVRWMVVVGGHLHGELAAPRQGARQSREQCVVVVDPMQRGVRKDQIDRPRGRPLGDVAELEDQPIVRVIGASLEHRRRRVETDRAAGTGSLMQRASQFAGAAAEIHDAASRTRLHQVEQVEERR
jgi:hypothetical protein